MSTSLPEAETPDPAAARLAAKIRLLMLISGLTTVVAIGAVMFVIGYRVFKAEGSITSAAVTEVTARLPKNARILGTATAGDRIAVTIQIAEAIEIRTFDSKTLQPAGRLRFVNEP